MNIALKRISSIIYQSDTLLEQDFDPISLSGTEYWAQEARSAKITLTYDDSLRAILEGNLREVKAGFHTFRVFVHHQGALIFTGLLPEAGYSVRYSSLQQKTVELELMDSLGLLLKLADDRFYTITEHSLNPVNIIPDIIRAILYPLHAEPDTDAYSNADIARLMLCTGSINYQWAHLAYDQNKWLPYRLIKHLLLDSASIVYSPLSVRHFGFMQTGTDVFLVWWEFRDQRPHQGEGSFSQHFRFRKWRTNLSSLILVEQNDTHNNDPQQLMQPPPPPDLADIVWGIGTYLIEASKAYYSGPASIQSVPVLPGSYKASDLLGEYLRIANAVLFASDYTFNIHNRLDLDRPTISFSDALDAEVTTADISKPQLSPVSLLSQATLDAVSRHYNKILCQFPYEISLKLHSMLDQFSALSLSNPYALIWLLIDFDGYRIYPSEVSWNIDSGEIEISGRCNRIGTPHE